jgi:6-phosphogluconolactonase (cycloisomerase 2 family)
MKGRLILGAAIVAVAATAFPAGTGATGGPQFCPPGDVETLLGEQIGFLGGLDPSPGAGIGTAKTSPANAGRFASLQQRLQDAIAALAGGDTAAALEAIASALAKTDGAQPPPDWLTGANAAALAAALGCISGAIDSGAASRDLYVMMAPDGTVGPQRIAGEAIGAGGSLSSFGTFATNGEHNLNLADQGIAVSPDRRLVFVSHGASKEVEAFGRLADGSLISASVVPTTYTPTAIVVHPTLPLIYVSENDHPATLVGQVSVYAYSPEGLLTPVQTRVTANETRGIAIAPNGTALVTTHIGFPIGNTVQVYALDGSGTLSLAPVDSLSPAGASRIEDAAFDSAGSSVYVEDLDSGIYAYSISGAGMLTALNGGNPYPASSLINVDLVTVPGALIVVSLESGPSANLYSFPITATGLGSPTVLAVPDYLLYLAVTGDGTTLFASSRTGDQVRSFTVGAGGTLIENVGSPFAIPTAATENVGNLVVVE